MNLTTSFARAAALLGSLLPLATLAQYSTPMRNVDNPDRFPYQDSVSLTIGVPYVNGFAMFSTPLGKRYVVEFVSLNCTTPSASDTFPQVFLYVNRGGSTPYVVIPMSPMTRTGVGVFGSGYVWVGQTQLKAYADPISFSSDGGQGLFLNIFRTDASQVVNCTAAVTGHSVTP